MKIKITFIALWLVVFTGISQNTYTLSKESVLNINGTSTVHDWTVKANTLHGNLTYGEKVEDVELRVVAPDIESGRAAAMDKKMHEALKAEKHPEITFKFQNLSDTDPKALQGVLAIAGKDKQVVLPSEITEIDNGFRIKGSYALKLQDYGMEPPTAMFGQIVVGDTVTVDYNLVFVGK